MNEKKLLFFHSFSYERQIAQLDRLIQKMNDVMSAYNILGLPALIMGDFKLLFSNPAEFVFDKITDGKDVSINGVSIDKIKAMEIIKKPAGYNEFLNTAGAVNKWLTGQLISISSEKVSSLNQLFDIY